MQTHNHQKITILKEQNQKKIDATTGRDEHTQKHKPCLDEEWTGYCGYMTRGMPRKLRVSKGDAFLKIKIGASAIKGC
jgi:hypothetical protein